MILAVITGSRSWSDRTPIVGRLEQIGPELACVIEGGAKGADRIAGQWAAAARKRGVGWVRFPADWKKNGRAAGPLRNREMLDWAEQARDRVGWEPFVLAFPGPESIGTWDMVNEAKRRGIKGVVVRGS